MRMDEKCLAGMASSMVSFADTLATVYFNNERLFDVVDGTFRGPGRIGLWTKADSVTWFDNFTFSGH